MPIADHVYGAEVGDVTENGWEVVRVDESLTGFQGALYKGEYEGNTEYIYATAGTQGLGDARADMKQVVGDAEQYVESAAIATNLSEEYSGVSFTGHSLGGGLASANALTVEGKAVTFNAAGLSANTKTMLGVGGNTADITAYIVSGEALDLVQRNTGLRAEGQHKIFLPATGGGPIKNHMMNSVKEGFKIRQDILKGPHKTYEYKVGN